MASALRLCAALLLASLVQCQDAGPDRVDALVETILDNFPVAPGHGPRGQGQPSSLQEYLLSVTPRHPTQDAAPDAGAGSRAADEPAALVVDGQSDGVVGTRARPRRVTPYHLQFEPLYLINRDTTVPDYGNFLVMKGSTASFQSPNYPQQYQSYVWTSWSFKGYEPDSTLLLSCQDFGLGYRDYLVVREEGGGYEVFDRRKSPYQFYRKKFVVELRTSKSYHGRIRCSARALGDSGGGGSTTTTGGGSTTTGGGSTTSGGGSTTTGGGPTTGGGSVTPAQGAVQVNDPVCGKTNYRLRIVGGEAAPQHAYPWLVGLAPAGSSSPFCGGTIINELYVVTAAHCVIKQNKGNIRILVRKHRRGSDPREMSIKVSDIKIHPEYNEKISDKDLALIRLDQSLRSLLRDPNGQVRPICLPDSCGSGLDGCFNSGTVTVAGWGVLQYDENSVPNVVQHVSVPVVSNAVCDRAYSGGGSGRITENMICAGESDGGKDSCQGDSGGPLVSKDNAFVYTLRGIVSFGYECAAPNYPGVYTRVSKFSSWIKQNARV